MGFSILCRISLGYLFFLLGGGVCLLKMQCAGVAGKKVSEFVKCLCMMLTTAVNFLVVAGRGVARPDPIFFMFSMVLVYLHTIL